MTSSLANVAPARIHAIHRPARRQAQISITQSWPEFTALEEISALKEMHFRQHAVKLDSYPLVGSASDWRQIHTVTFSPSRISTLRHLAIAVAAAFIAQVLQSADAHAGSRVAKAPEIFFLGDSHLSFGAGRIFRDFFKNFEENCKADEQWPGQARAIAKRSFGLMGVKSTALHTWVSRHRSLKRMVCVPDPKWPVNARLYGFPHRKDGVYVQLGKDPSFPFCRRPESGMEAVFRWGKPRLLVLYFMGNTITRWANSPRSAASDVKRFMKQLPKTTGCVFLTTSPVYRRKDNRRRVKAQTNIRAAFAKHGQRCKFVDMLTPATVKAIEGRAKYFRRNDAGRVKDPYHPNIKAARRMLALRKQPFCRAVMMSLSPQRDTTLR